MLNVKSGFEPHLGELALLRGLADGSVLAGELVVSHHNNGKARVIVDPRSRINCNGFLHRNRALSGDKVYVSYTDGEIPLDDSHQDSVSESTRHSFSELSDAATSDSVKFCKVVGIQKRSGQRYVSRMKPGEALVQPRDTRFPAMRSSAIVEVEKTSLGLFNFVDWEETEQYPDCGMIRILGPEGSFDAEDDSALEMNGLSSDPYPAFLDDELRKSFPDAESVVRKALPNRRDIRETDRIFSIDPPSAKDLDDAISVSRKEGNHWKIGVHVADVSHFVTHGSTTDLEAAKRATSVYLARKVYPMLPAYLSENLCSLLPGEDRLAVSVFFVLDGETGELVGLPSIDRTVIRSMLKLSYDDVDDALCGKKPVVTIPKPVMEDIEILMKLTEKLRCNRIASGSVTIDDRNNQDLTFEFLPSVESPVSVRAEARPSARASHDSHTLIEELMVMTNRIIAETLCEASDITVPVLRRHVDSEGAVMEAAKNFLAKARVDIPGPFETITDLLVKARQLLDPSLFSALTHSILGEFNRAEYVTASDGEGLAHWGVGAKRYMHFTSPIRRYADLIVHRKLGQILGWNKDVDGGFDEKEQLKKCNRNSKAAKDAERDNRLFYFTSLVKSFGNHGMYVDAIIKDLVIPDVSKNIKGSLCFFIPAIGDSRSQSLESLGLSLVGVERFEDDSVKLFNVRSRDGKFRSLKALEKVLIRLYVKNPSVSIPKLHVRMDEIPYPSSLSDNTTGNK